jgi:hypothetical protein
MPIANCSGEPILKIVGSVIRVAEHNMVEQPFAVVCAWCNRIVNAPARRTPVTHTICPSCLERALAQQGGTAHDGTAGNNLNLQPDYLRSIFRH